MKTLKMTKRILIATLTMLMFVCVGFVLNANTNTQTAQAESTFSMIDGASLRLDPNHQGLRFSARAGSDYAEIDRTYYMMITSVEIGDSVTSIGSDGFRSCYKLVEVINKSKLNITKGSSSNGYVRYDM